MKELLLIVMVLMVLGCGIFRSEKVVKVDDNAKVGKSKILSKVNVIDILEAHFASLSPGNNEVKTEYDGRSRRLIVATPKSPILSTPSFPSCGPLGPSCWRGTNESA